jgi:glycine hydroxymethyltransferase
MGVAEMARVASWIDEVVSDPENDDTIARVKRDVAELCRSFPAPGISIAD